jgi:hypothetical protein
MYVFELCVLRMYKWQIYMSLFMYESITWDRLANPTNSYEFNRIYASISHLIIKQTKFK